VAVGLCISDPCQQSTSSVRHGSIVTGDHSVSPGLVFNASSVLLVTLEDKGSEQRATLSTRSLARRRECERKDGTRSCGDIYPTR
jgi:hypothetical protein